MCELMRRVVNLEVWGLGDVAEPDTSVEDRFWLGDRACTQCRRGGEGTHGFCSHRTKSRRHRFHCEEWRGQKLSLKAVWGKVGRVF